MKVIDMLNLYLTEEERRKFEYYCCRDREDALARNKPNYYHNHFLNSNCDNPRKIARCFCFSSTEEGYDYWLSICLRKKPIHELFMVKYIKKHEL